MFLSSFVGVIVVTSCLYFHFLFILLFHSSKCWIMKLILSDKQSLQLIVVSVHLFSSSDGESRLLFLTPSRGSQMQTQSAGALVFHRCGCWWPGSHDVVVMRCGVVCLAATEAYVSDRALIQNTLQPLFLLVHTHTHTHLAVAADGDLYGHRYKRHQFSLFHLPCLQQQTERERASSSTCEVEQAAATRSLQHQARILRMWSRRFLQFWCRTGGTDTKDFSPGRFDHYEDNDVSVHTDEETLCVQRHQACSAAGVQILESRRWIRTYTFPWVYLKVESVVNKLNWILLV